MLLLGSWELILGLYNYNVVSPGPCILNLKDGACVLSSFFYLGFQIQRWAVVLLPFPFNNYCVFRWRGGWDLKLIVEEDPSLAAAK